MRRGAKPGKIGAIVSHLGAAIVRGEVAPGAALPPEPELEARYGAGRGVVREAVKVLAAKGLLSVRPRHGTHVRPAQDWSMLDRDVLGWLAGGDGLGQQVLLALEETRAIIEPAAAALAAERATAEDCARITAAFAAMERARDDAAAAIVADKAFHLAIIAATHNPILRGFSNAIDTILSALFDITVGVFAGNLPNHKAVAAAIVARDPDGARQAMATLLGYTRQHLITEGGHR